MEYVINFNTLKNLIDMAEDRYKFSKLNASHSEFLQEDLDILNKSKNILNRLEQTK